MDYSCDSVHITRLVGEEGRGLRRPTKRWRGEPCLENDVTILYSRMVSGLSAEAVGAGSAGGEVSRVVDDMPGGEVTADEPKDDDDACSGIEDDV